MKQFIIDLQMKANKNMDIVNYSWNSQHNLSREKIDLKFLIADTISLLDYLPNFGNTKIKINVRQNHPFYSDPNMLRIIIKNLVVNALQFQRENNSDMQVSIRATVSDEKLTLKISDNGRGIPSTHLCRVFEMFVKLDPSHSGAGLGLYRVKQALQKLEGNILVSSEIKKGSTFTVQIRNEI